MCNAKCEMWNVPPFTTIPHPTLPSSETVSAHNQGPWWDQLSISGHKRIDLVQHGVAHVRVHTHALACRDVQRRASLSKGVLWEIRDWACTLWALLCVFVCPGHALKWELYVCRRECVCVLCVSLKCCLFRMGSCIVEAAITLVSFDFFRHYASLSDS